MSDGMTDTRGQSEQVLTQNELSDFQERMRTTVTNMMMSSNVFEDWTVGQVKSTSFDIALAAQAQARNISR